MEDFKAALALDPNHTAHNVHLHLGLCKVLVKLGRGKDALSSCSDALDIDEELIDALVQVCEFLFADLFKLLVELTMHDVSCSRCVLHQDEILFFIFGFAHIHKFTWHVSEG